MWSCCEFTILSPWSTNGKLLVCGPVVWILGIPWWKGLLLLTGTNSKKCPLYLRFSTCPKRKKHWFCNPNMGGFTMTPPKLTNPLENGGWKTNLPFRIVTLSGSTFVHFHGSVVDHQRFLLATKIPPFPPSLGCLRKLVNGWDEWVITPNYTSFIPRLQPIY